MNATGPWTTVIGVIGDIRHGGLEEEPQPEMYISYLQGPPVSLGLRTNLMLTREAANIAYCLASRFI